MYIFCCSQFDFIYRPRFCLHFSYHFINGINTNGVIRNRGILPGSVPQFKQGFLLHLTIQIPGCHIQCTNQKRIIRKYMMQVMPISFRFCKSKFLYKTPFTFQIVNHLINSNIVVNNCRGFSYTGKSAHFKNHH